MNGHPVLEQYERICSIMTRMRAAARSEDWDRLVELESVLPDLFARVRALDTEVLADDAARARKAELIRHVLDEDAVIRACVEPRLAELQQVLGAAGKERRLATAYTAPR